VLVDRISEFNVSDTVTVDNIGAGATAAKFLADNGHRRLLVTASHMSFTPIRERYKGAHDEMCQHGGSVELVELGPDPRKGAEILAKWLDAHPLPSAIFATTDVTTLAVLTCMSAMLIDLPDQISVVGFDDYEWMQARRTGITAIKQPVDAIAKSVWAQLKIRITGDDGKIVNIVHDCDLVVRQSVQKLQGHKACSPTAISLEGM
jgi:LacI family transcriptional regulator